MGPPITFFLVIDRPAAKRSLFSFVILASIDYSRTGRTVPYSLERAGILQTGRGTHHPEVYFSGISP